MQYATINNSIITLGNTDGLTNGRRFESRFLQPGLAGYPGQYGNALIRKENLDKFINTLINKPVIINHKTEISENDKAGEVLNVWFNPADGWYWCSGVIYDNEAGRQAQNLIKNRGWSVSCSYSYTKSAEGGTENNIPYDIEFLDGEFEHLAIVENPRYERANIVFNAKNADDNIEDWITVKGNHIPVYKGQTKEEAIQDFIDGAKGYSETGKQSNRSIAAVLRGLGNKSDLSKVLGFKQKDLPEDILFASEWHHEGKQYKKEKYYYIDAYKDMQKNGEISAETAEKYDLTGSEIRGIKDSWALIEKKMKTETPEGILTPFLEKYKEDDFLQDKLQEALSRKKNISLAGEEIRRAINWFQTGEITEEKLKNIIDFYSAEEREKRKNTVRNGNADNMEVNNGWVTLHDKEGEPYHVELDDKEEKTETKQKTEEKPLKTKKTTVTLKSGKTKEIEYVDEAPKGWKKDTMAMTAPLGYDWYHNGKSLFSGERKSILVKDKTFKNEPKGNKQLSLFNGKSIKDIINNAIAQAIADKALGEL